VLPATHVAPTHVAALHTPTSYAQVLAHRSTSSESVPPRRGEREHGALIREGVSLPYGYSARVRWPFKRPADARRILLSLAAIAAALALVGVADDAASTDRSHARSQGPGPVAAATQTRRFEASRADGEPAVRVRGRRRGNCNSSSFVNGGTTPRAVSSGVSSSTLL
jgi:hypothetical protein